MKKKFLLTMLFTAVAAVGVIVVSCQKERAPGELLDLDMSNISVMTPGQQAVFDEATRRLDKHISFDADDGQYVMKTGLTAAKVGLSKRLFDYFQRNFEATNMQLLQQKAQGYVAVEVSKNCVKIVNPEDGFETPTKAFPDDKIEGGGVDDWEMRWFGMDVYLSNSTLKYIHDYGKYPAYVSALADVPLGVGLTIITEMAGDGYEKYPNGVIVSFVPMPNPANPVFPVPVPVNYRPQ